MLIFLLKSDMEPMFANSSKKQNTSFSHFPVGCESAYLTNLINKNVKNKEDKKSLEESTSLVTI